MLYDGPPLAVGSVVQKTFVDGDLYFDLEADRERQATIDEIKARLLPAEETDEADETDGEDTPDEPEPEPEPSRAGARDD